MKERLERLEDHVKKISLERNLKLEWLDNEEAADILRVSTRQMQNYRDRGKIPFSQNGNKIYYRLRDIEAYLMRHYKC